MLWKFANHRDQNSLAARLRQLRRERCREVILSIPRPMNFLDIGGGEEECAGLGILDQPDIAVTILNIEPQPTGGKKVRTIVADARDLSQFHDKEFDFVFTNSVIEHVGNDEDVRRMANEIRRVGKRYYVQTPNRYFPIEPHFVFPFFQFLPIICRVALVRNFNLGWIPKTPDRQEAERLVRSVNLLSKSRMKELFPDAMVTDERLLGFSKAIQCLKVVP